MTKRRFVRSALVLVLALAPSACAKHRGGEDTQEPGKEAFGKLTIDELDARMADAKAGKIKLAVFDNNKRERFDKGHLPGAKWVQFNAIKESDLPAEKDATLVFYCANEH